MLLHFICKLGSHGGLHCLSCISSSFKAGLFHLGAVLLRCFLLPAKHLAQLVPEVFHLLAFLVALQLSALQCTPKLALLEVAMLLL